MSVNVTDLRRTLRKGKWNEDSYHDFQKNGWYITIRNENKIQLQVYNKKEEEILTTGWEYLDDCKLMGGRLYMKGIEVRLV